MPEIRSRFKNTGIEGCIGIGSRGTQLESRGCGRYELVKKVSLKPGKVSQLSVTMMEKNWTLLVVTNVENY